MGLMNRKTQMTIDLTIGNSGSRNRERRELERKKGGEKGGGRREREETEGEGGGRCSELEGLNSKWHQAVF